MCKQATLLSENLYFENTNLKDNTVEHCTVLFCLYRQQIPWKTKTNNVCFFLF